MKGDWVVLDRYSGLQHNMKKMLLAFASKFLSFIVNSKYSNSMTTPLPVKCFKILKLVFRTTLSWSWSSFKFWVMIFSIHYLFAGGKKNLLRWLGMMWLGEWGGSMDFPSVLSVLSVRSPIYIIQLSNAKKLCTCSDMKYIDSCTTQWSSTLMNDHFFYDFIDQFRLFTLT